MHFLLFQELLQLSSDNFYLRLLLIASISGFFTYLLSVKHLFLWMYNLYQSWRHRYTVIEIKSEANITESNWTQNKALYGLNGRLIEAVLSYCARDKNSNLSRKRQIHLSTEGLDSNYLEETSYVNFLEEFRNRLVIKPIDKISLSPPYDNLTVTYRHITGKQDNLITRTQILTIKVVQIEFDIVNKFLEECYDLYCKRIFANYDDKQFFLITYYSKDGRMICKPIELQLQTSFERLFFNEKQALIKSIDSFINKENNYGYRKFSLLLHGPPGTGKTSVIKALARYTNRHLHYVKLSTIRSLQDALDILFGDCGNYLSNDNYHQQIKPNNKIIVFEDIDADSNVTHKRTTNTTTNTTNTNTTNTNTDNTEEVSAPKSRSIQELLTSKGVQPQLSLADVLQLFDGVIEVEGVMIVATTNHIHKLDDALIRKGRFTKIIEMGKINYENAKAMIEYYSKLSGKTVDQEYINGLSIQDGVNPAELEYHLQSFFTK